MEKIYKCQKQITINKNSLNATDHKAIKTSEKIVLLLAQKFLSESNPDLVAELSALTAQRQSWRDEINLIEKQIEILKNQ